MGLFVLRGPIQHLNENLAVVNAHYISPIVSYFRGVDSASSSGKTLPDYLQNNYATGQNSVSGSSTSTASSQNVIPEVTAGSKPVLVSKDNTLSADNSGLTIQGVLNQTNKERSAKGAGALRLNSNLNKSAEAKLQDMFTNQYFEHISPTGVNVSDVVRKMGYEYIVVGENLALGNFGGDVQVVTAWMNSPGHRANILDSRFQEMGVAVGRGQYNGKEQWIAVQHFAKPLSSCSGPNAALKSKIDSHTTELAVREVDLNKLKSQIDGTNPASATADSYRVSVEKYNDMVVDYNTRLGGLKDEIKTYNEQVRSFNSCAGLAGSTAGN